MLGSAIAEVAQQGVDAQWEPKLGEMMGGGEMLGVFCWKKILGVLLLERIVWEGVGSCEKLRVISFNDFWGFRSYA